MWRLAGPAAAVAAFGFAAFGLLVSTDLPRTALYGSSEPLLVVFVLLLVGAIHQSYHQDLFLLLVAQF